MPRSTTGSVIEHEGRDGHAYRSLRFYAQSMRRGDDEQATLRAVVDGVESAGQEPSLDLSSGRVLV
jgi:hypothetical protein